MKRWMFVLIVFGAFVVEATWASWVDSSGPLTQLADVYGAPSGQTDDLVDPLTAWRSDAKTKAMVPSKSWEGENAVRDAILVSAVWPGVGDCLGQGACERQIQRTSKRPL